MDENSSAAALHVPEYGQSAGFNYLIFLTSFGFMLL